jgi:hypothetical protein
LQKQFKMGYGKDMAHETSRHQDNPGLSQEVFGANYDYAWQAEHGKDAPGLVMQLGKRALAAVRAAMPRLRGRAAEKTAVPKTYTAFEQVGLSDFRGVRPDSPQYVEPATDVLPVITEGPAPETTGAGMDEIMHPATAHARKIMGEAATSHVIPHQRRREDSYIAQHAAPTEQVGRHRLNEDAETIFLPRVVDDDRDGELVGSSRGQ